MNYRKLRSGFSTSNETPPSELFDKLRATVGTPAMILVATAFLLLQFGEAAEKQLADHPVTALPAIGLFVLGALAGLSYSLKARFDVDAGKGFAHGAVAGLAAGLVGGIGYSWALPGADAIAGFAGTILISVAVGGFYGIALSLCHPSAKFAWRERATALAVFVTCIMLPVAIVAMTYGEWLLPKRFIAFRDVKYVLGTYILVKAALQLVGMVSARRYVARLSVMAIVLVLLGFAMTRVDSVNSIRFSLRESEKVPALIFVILTLLLSSSVIYFLATTENPLIRSLDAWVGSSRQSPRKKTMGNMPH